MHLLLSAYACDPGGVSEANFGWGWTTNLAARGIRVHVLTAERHREAIESELRERPLADVTVSFVEPDFPGVPNTIGGWHYFAWQFAAVKIARAIHREDPFDIAHHVTYGSVHVPSQLWRLKIPVVFGPVGGGQTAPSQMLSYFGRAQRSERQRTLITKLLSFSPLHRIWMAKMACVFTINQETTALVRRMGRRDVLPALEVGLPLSFYADSPRRFEASETCRLFWGGRLLPRKALPLALDAFQRVKVPATLTIAGAGIPPEEVHGMIKDRGLQDRVTWLGKVTWEEMRGHYRTHDAFLFTSLRDTCGVQLLEAMSLGLPIITLDHQGGTLLVPSTAGIKVPVSTPYATAEAIASAIARFSALSVEERNAMSECAIEIARTLSWPAHAERAHRTYLTLLEGAESSATVTPALSI